MIEEQPPSSLLDKLQHAVKMRPRWYFWLRTVGIALGTAALAVVMVFAIGALFFLWRSRELGVLPGFGFRGVPFLLGNFPWDAAILSFLGLVVLLMLLRRFTPSYRWPMLFVVALAVIGATFFGAWASRAPIHGILANRALRGELPHFFGRAYRPFLENDRVVVGEITKIKGDTYTLETPGGDVTVKVTDDTRLPPFSLTTGTAVVVIGERKGDRIEAEAIRAAHRRMMMPQRRHED
ncbi:MAG: hypothetical protein HY420_01990 [Candidatus Kerfeldbacteria bacterium]|nr:hypothetical protein [Candidatus Kerfeldbacteria bacterium]